MKAGLASVSESRAFSGRAAEAVRDAGTQVRANGRSLKRIRAPVARLTPHS